MNTDAGRVIDRTIDRVQKPLIKAYLGLGTLVCGATALLILVGKSPPMVEGNLLAALFYIGGCACFALAWRRLGDEARPLIAPQAFFLTAIPYLAAGVAVGSPSGDTRVPLVLVVLLLAVSLLRVAQPRLEPN